MTYHVPAKDKWEFDDQVTDIFEEMLSRSIPQYSAMREAVYSICQTANLPDGCIVDLGCSRGETIAGLMKRSSIQHQYIGCDISDPMIESARERFKNLPVNTVTIENCDLRRSFPDLKGSQASAVLSILTIQFVPMEYRQALLSRVYQSLQPGGIFVVVEKVLGATAAIDCLMVDLYYDLKNANGYSEYEIQRKRLSLEGVLVPTKARWNEESLREAGFTQVDCFWRWMNFAGFLAIK